ncbi:hypothetical protein K488DRAFT_83508 [Vararia minispora EC-137]|uniref:Uncharacterized protein n=1 Tax=Vararia minispora EC-137 TaxID=1314806 RepID=A0ACB8QSN9_9AGAM|nr:hypothetical protein K488DRAFT_83508 [Vararia minispora EC-137]
MLVSPRRHYATPPPQDKVSDLPIGDYHAIADHTMEYLLERLEEVLDEVGDPSYEVDYSSGVLTLKLGHHGTYVINKQPPNKQIWLSSPHSGPKRYDLSFPKRDWVYLRDDRSLGELLDDELGETLDAEGFELEIGKEVQRTVTEHFKLPPLVGSLS